MRYFNFVLNANQETIKGTAKIKLRDYDYDGCIAAVNKYMYSTMKTGNTFFFYREEDNCILTAFSFDEKKSTLKEAFDYIIDTLDGAFAVAGVKEEPSEITMFQFSECLRESRRRDFLHIGQNIADTSNLWIYYPDSKDATPAAFRFDERIIDSTLRKLPAIYDESLVKELENIQSHKNETGYFESMVHYMIAGKSMEAASDMAEILVQSLLQANRVCSSRIEIISEIHPELYKKNNHLEEIIENNLGGAIVIDLTEKFGHEPTDYLMTSKYLEKLVRTYRNQCLFIFTYNMNQPGFSYYLLPEIKKFIFPVTLREGSGNRKVAVDYLKCLIKTSRYAQYANQAGEFMKLFPGDSFSQTEVLAAYDQFDAWCMNKNILKAYHYELSDEFMLDRDSESSSLDKLNNMIGLSIVKEQIHSILTCHLVEKERQQHLGSHYETPSRHMVFGGNPGTAKTTVAKLFAGIAKEQGLLKSGAFVERGGMDLDGLGCVHVIREAFTAAKGGVLFIDEAYSLKSDTAITVLLQEMENQRDNVIVVLAGYNERMHEFMERNEGLKSRIPYWVEFPDYNTDELTEIFQLMLRQRHFTASEDALQTARYQFDKARYTDNFGNGRYVRNLLEHAIQNQSNRLFSKYECASSIPKKELFLLTGEDISGLEEGLTQDAEEGTAKARLDAMIGLTGVKAVIQKAIANYKLKKLCMNKGILKNNVSLHMVFTGNPGTAKTTVARLFAEILKDEKVLPTGKFVEVGRADLVGTFVGSTAHLVKKRFKEAQGGVLFIDEAYSLCDSQENSFGDEAINTIVQEMENHREDVIVIFAGYPTPMKHFLDRNPGMLSRIAFQVEFENYNVDELCEIAQLMLSQKQMTITDDAMDKMRKHFESVCHREDYGNGRFVRKLLEEVEMNLAQRLLALEEDQITEELLTRVEVCDVPDVTLAEFPVKRPLGFCV